MNIEELPQLPMWYAWVIWSASPSPGPRWKAVIQDRDWESVVFSQDDSLEVAVKDCWEQFQAWQKEHGE